MTQSPESGRKCCRMFPGRAAHKMPLWTLQPTLNAKRELSNTDQSENGPKRSSLPNRVREKSQQTEARGSGSAGFPQGLVKPDGLWETGGTKKPELTDAGWLGPRNEMDRSSHRFGKCSNCHEIICVEKAVTDGPSTQGKMLHPLGMSSDLVGDR